MSIKIIKCTFISNEVNKLKHMYIIGSVIKLNNAIIEVTGVLYGFTYALINVNLAVQQYDTNKRYQWITNDRMDDFFNKFRLEYILIYWEIGLY